MIPFAGQAILMDIEGTISSISFVHDVLCPYARHELTAFLQSHWDEPAVAATCHQIARDAGVASFEQWCGGAASPDVCVVKVRNEVLRLLDAGTSTPGLTELQELIWRLGFRKGVLTAQLLSDVAPALERWNQAGLKLASFASGSAAVQRAFFSHTEAGNLNTLFSNHFDATIGEQREPASYASIAGRMELPASDILFLSGDLAKLDAARGAGLQTAAVIRAGNPPLPEEPGHAVLSGFDEIDVQPSLVTLPLALSSEQIPARPAA